MFSLLSPSLAALVLAVLRNRSLAGVTRMRIAAWPLGLVAFAAALALTTTPVGRHPFGLMWGSAVWVGALIMLLAVLARNAWVCSSASRWPWTLAAMGVLLNIVVV